MPFKGRVVNSLYFSGGMFLALQLTCCEFTLLFRRYVSLPFKGRVVNSFYKLCFLPFKGRVVNSPYFSGGVFFAFQGTCCEFTLLFRR